MEFLAIIIAKLLDPIGLIMCLILLLKYPNKYWSLPFAAFASGLTTETILTSNQLARDWGDGLLVSIFGGFIQAIFIYGILKLKSFFFRK